MTVCNYNTKTDMYTIKEKSVCINTDLYIERYHNPQKFIQFCKECKMYNSCWSCPPFDFETKAYLLKYTSIWFIGTQIFPSQFERSFATKEELILYEQDLLAKVRGQLDPLLLTLENKYPESRACFAGTCHFCTPSKCKRNKNLPCIYPQKIRPSLEALGFDIEHTTSDLLGIELLWSKNNILPEYYTLVSAFLTNNKIKKLR